MRNPGLRKDKLEKMMELYSRGREGSTMKSYNSSYRRLVELCRQAEVSIFRMEEEQRCAIWVEAGLAGLAGISAAGGGDEGEGGVAGQPQMAFVSDWIHYKRESVGSQENFHKSSWAMEEPGCGWLLQGGGSWVST